MRSFISIVQVGSASLRVARSLNTSGILWTPSGKAGTEGVTPACCSIARSLRCDSFVRVAKHEVLLLLRPAAIGGLLDVQYKSIDKELDGNEERGDAEDHGACGCR